MNKSGNTNPFRCLKKRYFSIRSLDMGTIRDPLSEVFVMKVYSYLKGFFKKYRD